MLVSDLMTRNTASVRGDQTLADAARLMWDYDCGAMPVMDPQGTRAIGMITDRDICMATWSRGAAPDTIRIAEVMSQDVVSCYATDSLDHAESLMQSNQIRRLPVMDAEGRLVGILSLADIARATQNKFAADGLSTTLAVICRSPSSSQFSASI